MLRLPPAIGARTGSPLRPGRRASATMWMLGALVVLSAVMASVFEWYRLQAARVELQSSADAAALGAAREFIDDRFLAGDPSDLTDGFALSTDAIRNQALAQRIASARDQALQYAYNNGVFADPVALDANDANDPCGDVLLGRLNCPRSRVFYAGDLTVNGQPPAPLLVNAVRIHAHATKDFGDSVVYRWAQGLGVPPLTVEAAATALLDRDVIGFQADDGRPAPLAPIALLSDPTGANQLSWEHLVEQANGLDQFQYDPVGMTTSAGSDGLHEFPVTFPGGANPANACVLGLGVSQWSDFTTQLASGVTAAQMEQLPNSQLVLDSNGQFLATVLPYPSDPNSADAQALYAALQALQASAAPRVWPLFQGFDAATGDAVLTGFVAARVVQAPDANNPSGLILQPCLMSTASAVTDAARRPANMPVGNPYLCRIRVVE